jgi:hypothetical protein
MGETFFVISQSILIVLACIALLNLTLITFSYFFTPLLEVWRERTIQRRKIWEAQTDARLERLERQKHTKENDTSN